MLTCFWVCLLSLLFGVLIFVCLICNFNFGVGLLYLVCVLGLCWLGCLFDLCFFGVDCLRMVIWFGLFCFGLCLRRL